MQVFLTGERFLTAIYAKLWLVPVWTVAPLVRLRVAQPSRIAAEKSVFVYVLELIGE